MLNFNDQVAVVTGAAQGAGAAFAELLAARGAKVVVNDIDVDESNTSKAELRAAAIRDSGAEAVANNDSVATEAGAKVIVETAIDSFGRVDIVIHNTGSTSYRPFAEITYDEYQAQ